MNKTSLKLLKDVLGLLDPDDFDMLTLDKDISAIMFSLLKIPCNDRNGAAHNKVQEYFGLPEEAYSWFICGDYSRKRYKDITALDAIAAIDLLLKHNDDFSRTLLIDYEEHISEEI